MKLSDWESSTDAGAMLDFLWHQRGIAAYSLGIRVGGELEPSSASHGPHAELERALHRFYLAVSRRLFPLLPEKGSRDGVEMGEKFLVGQVSAEALLKFTWHTEAAAFEFDYDLHPEYTGPLIAAVQAMPPADLRSLLHPPEVANQIEPRELLKRAAYFADYAMIYPSLKPKGPPPHDYRIFLPAPLLREYVQYPAASANS